MRCRSAPALTPGRSGLTPSAEGVVPREVKGGLAFRFGFVPLLGTDAAEKENVNGRVVPNGKDGPVIELDAPAWFKP